MWQFENLKMTRAKGMSGSSNFKITQYSNIQIFK